MSYSAALQTSLDTMEVHFPTPDRLIGKLPCRPSCIHGGTCEEGVCQCPYYYTGAYCEDNVLRYIVIGCLIGAVCICSLAIIGFIIYQRVQDANLQDPRRRVCSVRIRRHLSRNDRTKALARVEIPPDYEEAAQCEQSGSTYSKKSQNPTTLDVVIENADSSQNETDLSNNNKLKPSMSDASRLLERALVTRRPKMSESRAIQHSARRSNSAPSTSAEQQTRPCRPQKEAKTRPTRISGPTRAISVPGKVVQVIMEEEE